MALFFTGMGVGAFLGILFTVLMVASSYSDEE